MIAKIWNLQIWTPLTDERTLSHELEKMLAYSGFNIIDRVGHAFTPYGYTALWLLGESHLAYHSFPEQGRTYIELSSCIEDKYDTFCKLLDDHPIIKIMED